MELQSPFVSHMAGYHHEPTAVPVARQDDQAFEGGLTLVIVTLDRLGRSMQGMLAFVEALRGRGAGLQVLNHGGEGVGTAIPMGSMISTVMAALAQLELEIRRGRITDLAAQRRDAGKDVGGRRQIFTSFQAGSVLWLVESGEPATQVARDHGVSRPPSADPEAAINYNHVIAACPVDIVLRMPCSRGYFPV